MNIDEIHEKIQEASMRSPSRSASSLERAPRNASPLLDRLLRESPPSGLSEDEQRELFEDNLHILQAIEASEGRLAAEDAARRLSEHVASLPRLEQFNGELRRQLEGYG
jgi:hypothetical protein